MKKIILLIIIFFCFSCKKSESRTKYSQEVVQDYAQFFSEIENSLITKKILDFEKITTNEICIYTLDSIPSNISPLYHATNIFNELGVGKKEKNNGLLILISRLDRQIAISTGSGTEMIMTDSICKNLIDSTIVPSFKEKNYFEGISSVLDSLIVKWK